MAESVGAIYYEVEAETSKLVNGIKSTNAAFDAFATGAKNADAATNKLNTQMRETAKAAKEASSGAQNAAAGFASLYKIALAYVGLGTLKAMAELADQYGQNADRIKNATASTEEYNLVQERLLQTANGTYRALSEAQEVYLSTADVLRDLGYSTNEVLDITDSFSYALVRDAARADQATSAMDAYSKALQKGKVESDAWASVMAATPSIVNGIAEATGKSANEIRKLGAEGKLSVEALNEGLLRSLESNKTAAEGMSVSTKDAVTAMRNSLQVFIGKVDEASGASGVFAENVAKFSEILQDPETIQAAADFANDIVAAINFIIEEGKNLYIETKALVRNIRALFGDIDGTDLEKLQERLGNFEKAKNAGFLSKMFDGYSEEELDAEIASLKQRIDAGVMEVLEAEAKAADKIFTQEERIEKKRNALVAATSNGDKGGNGKRASDKQAEQAANYLKALGDQMAALQSMTNQERVAYDVRRKNVVLTEKQLQLAQQMAASIDNQSNVDVITSLALEMSKAAMSAQQLAEYNALSRLNPAATPEQVETVRKMANELDRIQRTKQLLDDVSKAGGLDSWLGGAPDAISGGGFDSDAQRFIDELNKEQERYRQKMIKLAEYHSLVEISEEEHYRRLQELAEEHSARMAQIERSKNEAMLNQLNLGMGGMTDGLKAALGEQSAAYKAAAIAQTIVQTYQSAQAAYTALAGIPVVGPALATTAAAAAVAGGMARVNAIRSSGGRQYGGPVAAGGMYRINENGAPEVLNMANGKQFLLPNSRGEVISNKDAAAASSPDGRVNLTVQLVENASRGGQVDQSQLNEQGVLRIFVASIRNGSEAAQAIEGTYGVTRRGR